ncbi:MAG: cryptochrome/photolyase family protein [Bacteroidia bacterium]|nr:MAG: cryptochrome/photolyase family protein [Bacteroidia bacterium]
MQTKILRLILGDQLNIQHSWFKEVRTDVLYVMMEIRQETDYVQHHIQKVMAFFLAMRNFAEELKNKGHQVHYIKLDDPNNTQLLTQNLIALIDEHHIVHFEYQLPDEYRLDVQLKQFCTSLKISHKVYDTEHFYSSRNELADFFKGKKTFLMESFYRHMRKKHGVMMQGENPIADKWNFDAENRKALPKDLKIPEPKIFKRSVSELYSMLNKQGVKTIGTVYAENFIWPITRKQNLELLEYFAKKLLPLFGNYQDAMTTQSWSVFHSRLSFGMNVKLISPQEVVNRCIAEWEKRPNEISISQIEGFVRQILGWREYMRGIYWAKMPEYSQLNFFNHQQKLPEWFWTGKTKMNCLHHAIKQSLDYSYAHHIQRLMITGNFALLTGVHPDEVDKWYLGIYIDAIEWVEITNTRGMSQFADGGIVGTKPYISSAAYIDKMSNYCKGCYYDKSKKTGGKACPFNSLYWNFYDSNRKLLEKNPRIGMMYKVWDKMQPILNRKFYIKLKNI